MTTDVVGLSGATVRLTAFGCPAASCTPPDVSWHNRCESARLVRGPVLVAHPSTPIALIVGSGGWSADAVGTTKVYAAQGVAVAAAVVAVGLYRGVSVAKHVSVGLGSLGSGSRSRTVNR
jgi:hypothetical protein